MSTHSNPSVRRHASPFIQALALAGACSAAGMAGAVTLTALPGAQAQGKVTGIYAVSSVSMGGKVRVTRALVCAGSARELHTTNGAGGWLSRTPKSSAPKVSTSTFASLTSQAGGVDKDVTAMSQTVRNAFMAACGGGAIGGGGSPGSGGTAPPSQVPPSGKTGCPQGYQYNFTTKQCHLLSRLDRLDGPPRLAGHRPDWALRLFDALPMGSAHAFIKDIHKKINVSWRWSNVGGGFSYSYQPVDGVPPGYPSDTVGVIQVEGGGFSVQWLVGSS